MTNKTTESSLNAWDEQREKAAQLKTHLDTREARRKEINGLLRKLDEERGRLASLPPAVQELVAQWSQQLSAQKAKFIHELQMGASAGRVPVPNFGSPAGTAYLLAGYWEDVLPDLALKVTGGNVVDTDHRRSRLMAITSEIITLKSELGRLGG